MLGVFLRIKGQQGGLLLVILIVAGAPEGSRNGMNGSPAPFDADLGFRTGTENPVMAIIKIKKIGGGVDRPQGPVNIKIIALKGL